MLHAADVCEVHDTFWRLHAEVQSWQPELDEAAAEFTKLHSLTRHTGVNRFRLVEELRQAAGLPFPPTDAIADKLRGTWVEQLLLTVSDPGVVCVSLYGEGCDDRSSLASAVACLSEQVHAGFRLPGLLLRTHRDATPGTRCLIMSCTGVGRPWDRPDASSRFIEGSALPAFDRHLLPAYWLRLLGHRPLIDVPTVGIPESVEDAEPIVKLVMLLHDGIQRLQNQTAVANSERLRLASDLSELHRLTKQIGVNRTTLLDDLKDPSNDFMPDHWTHQDQLELDEAVRGTWVDEFLLTVANPEVTKVFLWGAEAERILLCRDAWMLSRDQIFPLTNWDGEPADLPDNTRLIVFTSAKCPPPLWNDHTARYIEATELPLIVRKGSGHLGIASYWSRLLEVPRSEASEGSTKTTSEDNEGPAEGFLPMLQHELRRIQEAVTEGTSERLRMEAELAQLHRLTERPGVDKARLLAELRGQVEEFEGQAHAKVSDILRGTWVDDLLLAVSDPAVNRVFVWGDASPDREYICGMVVHISRQVDWTHEGAQLLHRFPPTTATGKPFRPAARVIIHSTPARPDPVWEQPASRFVEAKNLPGFFRWGAFALLQTYWLKLLGGSMDDLET